MVALEEHATVEAAAPPRDESRRAMACKACAWHTAALLLFALLTVSVIPAVIFHPASTVTPDLIDPLFYIWSLASAIHHATTWTDGLWSLFDANIYFPAPHSASYVDVTVGLLPISLPLHLLIHNPVVLFNTLIALSFVLSAYGAFLLGYTLTGNYWAGLIAGLVFGFCPFRFEHLGHLNILSTEWVIASALCLVQAWRRERFLWWALAGLCIGLSSVTDLYYLAYLTPAALTVAALLGRSWSWRRLQGALWACGIAALLVVPYMIPYLVRHVYVGPQYGGATSTDILGFFEVLRGRPLDSLVLPGVPIQMMQPNHGWFLGFLALGLALIAWWQRQGRLWAMFALACAIVALGPYLQVNGHVLPIPLPYAILQRVVPHFQLFRDPPRALIGLYLGLAILAAHGAHEVLRRVGQQERRVLLGVALAGLVALELWTPTPAASLAAIPAGESWLARQPRIRAIVELPFSGATPLDWQQQSAIMYDSTLHWKDLVNGSGSLEPNGVEQRRSVLSTYPSAQALALLRRLHVDAVVLRLAWLSPRQKALALAACHRVYGDTTEVICTP